MPESSKAVVVMPAYNAARTLERVYDDLDKDAVDEIVVVDDCSSDDTVAIARRLPVTVIAREVNGGYGANQKTCYDYARQVGADQIVMLHADFQYDARVLPAVLLLLRLGICDVILGNRIRTRTEALGCGMPASKYLANRGLTILENMLAGQNLGEWHSGFRAYSRAVLEQVPYQRNSDDFVFDSQFLVQCVHHGFRIGDIPVPVRYFAEASSISLWNSARYAWSTMGTFARWYGHRWGLRRDPLFEPTEPATTS